MKFVIRYKDGRREEISIKYTWEALDLAHEKIDDPRIEIMDIEYEEVQT